MCRVVWIWGYYVPSQLDILTSGDVALTGHHDGMFRRYIAGFGSNLRHNI